MATGPKWIEDTLLPRLGKVLKTLRKDTDILTTSIPMVPGDIVRIGRKEVVRVIKQLDCLPGFGVYEYRIKRRIADTPAPKHYRGRTVHIIGNTSLFKRKNHKRKNK